MLPINKNWTDEDGNHAGGHSIGIGWTIVWQRGPLNKAGRNGAFLIELLGECLEWMRVPLQPHMVIHGIGFTIVMGSREIPDDQRLPTLREVLEACLHQVRYYQNQPQFACEENQQAINSLQLTIETLPDIDESIVHLQMAQSALIMRRDRRKKAGTLGTHVGEAV
ncbi:MAG: hypothetical protein ACRC62_13140 [Microcoleus sp.]